MPWEAVECRGMSWEEFEYRGMLWEAFEFGGREHVSCAHLSPRPSSRRQSQPPLPVRTCTLERPGGCFVTSAPVGGALHASMRAALSHGRPPPDGASRAAPRASSGLLAPPR